MIGIRTPIKKPENRTDKSPLNTREEAESSTATTNVRQSVGEWESGKIDPKPCTSKAHPHSPKQTVGLAPVAPQKIKQKTAPSQDAKTSAPRTSIEATGASPGPSQGAAKPSSRTAQAKAWLQRAKTCVGESRNLKTDLKQGILKAVDHLFLLVKEAEASRAAAPPATQDREKVALKETEMVGVTTIETETLKRVLEEHSRLLSVNTLKMDELKEALQVNQESVEKLSYASAVANRTIPHAPKVQNATLHSIVVTSTKETETGDQVIDHIRNAVNAKEGWITVDRIRKAKDRKIVLGCRTEEGRDRIKQRLASAKEFLRVEDVKNKDPLVALKDVLKNNTDEDILKALRNQNKDLFDGLPKGEERVEVIYKKRARNPHTQHVVLRVAPKLWLKLQEKQVVHIDLQRIKVEDQSPLVQCSQCLGYGHGRKLCKDSTEKCSHCGGPHMRTQCPDWLAGTAPKCCNCEHEGLDRVEHNAFSAECPVRRRWDMLARSRVAYC